MSELENQNGSTEEIPVTEEPKFEEQKSDVQFDKDGKPNFANNQPDSTNNAEVVRKNMKKGAFIGALVTTIISLICTVASIIIFLSTIADLLSSESGDAGEALGIVIVFIMLLSVGWIVFIPGFASSIAGISCSAISMKSSKKGYRVFGIIGLIVNILCLAIILSSPLVLPYLF